MGAFLFFLCNNAPSSPSLETESRNTIEKTIEYSYGISEKPSIPVSRGDLFVDISLDKYNVGDKFIYSGKIQNTQESEITIEKGLEWRLLKGNQIIDSKKFNDNIAITFKKRGFIEFDCIDNRVKIKASSITIGYVNSDGEFISHNVPYIPFYPIPISIDMDIPVYVFKEAGTYTSQFFSTYFLKGKEYKTTFTSKEFEVGEK